MLDQRLQKAAQDLAEAISVGQGSAPGPVGPQGMSQPPGPLSAPTGSSQGPPGAPPTGMLGLGPNQNPSPLQAVPSFKSPPVESYLQKAEGMKGANQRPGGSDAVGFKDGGRVRFAVRGV